MTILRLLVLLAITGSGCVGADADDGLIDALRWYHRWIAELPKDTSFVDCKVAVFARARFAYCEPGAINVDLAPGSGKVVAKSVTVAATHFAAAVADFVNHRYSGSDRTPRIERVSIPATSLSTCKIDEKKTFLFVTSAIASTQRRELLNRGFDFRFPLACEGDPFYLIYFMKANEVQWIWQIQPPGLWPVWHYEKDSQQRRIPHLAIKNLSRPELWYRDRNEGR